MSTTDPFTPGTTQTISVTGTSSSTSLTGSSASIAGRTLRVAAPAGGQIAFVSFGASATVTTAALPILPGTVETFSIPAGACFVNAITATSTQTLYVTVGDGL